MPHRRQKSRARNNSLPDSRSHLMGVFSDDFAAVDVREELCYHSRPEKAKFKRCTEERKQNQKRKLCAAAKAAAGPQADQRGRLRAAALSRRRKLRFSAACQSNPPALLRYVSSSQKIFASQIFFGNPVDLVFPCCSGCPLRGVCLAAAARKRGPQKSASIASSFLG